MVDGPAAGRACSVGASRAVAAAIVVQRPEAIGGQTGVSCAHREERHSLSRRSLVWRDVAGDGRVHLQPLSSVPGQPGPGEKVGLSRVNSHGQPSGQSNVASGGTSKLAFMRSERVVVECLDVARQWRAHDATAGRVDRIRVEKVTNAGRPSGGTPRLAFMRFDRERTVCLDDARQ
jgi:hypothetical protein